ncbi:LysR substrate-binding domain-containing protein [Xinfangfangia pollutisoli]|uniref:LysR substrate-binding domain-containing protein n=1 Tax=Xinfangfangia pollutisoli TaxID=2865960 RepID=UPI001CD39805|nr:LysR substrate-binding domain-containing protein [Xinfangfangia pollutisoli]
MRIDPLTLRLFVRLAETGTIAAVAESENIAAAAVSRRISDLEALLQTPLALRSNKGAKLTSAGVELLSLARSALHEFDQIPVQMQGFSSGIKGLVRICTSTSALAQFLPSRVNSVLKDFPEIRVHFQEEISSQVPRAVMGNAADIGIFTDEVNDMGLETHPFHSDRLVVILPRDHELATRSSVTFAETLDYDYVGFSRDNATQTRLTRAAERDRRQVKVRVRVRTFEALCMMVSSGYCLGVLPEDIARRHAPAMDYTIVALIDNWAARQFRIGVRSSAALPSAARLMFDRLRTGAA